MAPSSSTTVNAASTSGDGQASGALPLTAGGSRSGPGPVGEGVEFLEEEEEEQEGASGVNEHLQGYLLQALQLQQAQGQAADRGLQQL